MDALKNTYVKPSQINLIITHDSDVYSQEGKLLLRFRKNKLTTNYVNNFYDNVIKFACYKTTNRGSTSGSKKKNVTHNPKIMTNTTHHIQNFTLCKYCKRKKLNILQH